MNPRHLRRGQSTMRPHGTRPSRERRTSWSSVTRPQISPNGPGAVIFAPSGPISRTYASSAVATGAPGTASRITVTFPSAAAGTTSVSPVAAAATFTGRGISSSRKDGLDGTECVAPDPARASEQTVKSNIAVFLIFVIVMCPVVPFQLLVGNHAFLITASSPCGRRCSA